MPVETVGSDLNEALHFLPPSPPFCLLICCVARFADQLVGNLLLLFPQSTYILVTLLKGLLPAPLFLLSESYSTSQRHFENWGFYRWRPYVPHVRPFSA